MNKKIYISKKTPLRYMEDMNMKTGSISWNETLIQKYLNLYQMLPEGLIVGKWRNLDLRIYGNKYFQKSSKNLEKYNIPLYIEKRGNSVYEFHDFYKGGLKNIDICRGDCILLEIDDLIMILIILSKWIRIKSFVVSDTQLSKLLIWINSYCWKVRLHGFHKEISKLQCRLFKVKLGK